MFRGLPWWVAYVYLGFPLETVYVEGLLDLFTKDDKFINHPIILIG